MTTRLFVSCAAACLISSTLFAQKPPPTPPARATNRVMVSGCVERVDQMQPAAATTVDGLSFVLIKPTALTPVGTSGSGFSSADSPPTNSDRMLTPTNSDRMYRLDAPVEQLNSHVGQKVEVTGTVPDVATAPAGAGSSTNAPRLRVDSVKVLDAMCRR